MEDEKWTLDEWQWSLGDYLQAGAFTIACLVCAVLFILTHPEPPPKGASLHERVASVPYKTCETLVPLLLTRRHPTVKLEVNGHVFNSKENPLPIDLSSLTRAVASCQPGSDNLLIVDETNP